ncbi:peptidoglycan DD-metalloendopeptidase family protein [Neptunicella marina]|uniref:Peptidoglycan DD-metalloendopeptidase family protein n=1 Tax=Neptunicella marina TaxID=2125989 RepID=A0A8J6IT01_9ALTE|nr:peptidoglycan DD-metalloendopeptidase family protein [Neptunicella marina]MBC3765177.1 peptidoglycan DD-metalloendopeptidase family protein [Neptunicella marina]
MVKSTFKKLPLPHKVLLAFTLSVTVILTLLPSEQASASKQTADDLVLGQLYPLPLHLDNLPDDAATDDLDSPDWKTYVVRSGDNLAKIFSRAGLSPQDVYAVSHAGKDAKKLLKMLPGDEIAILVNQQGQFRSLNYRFSSTESLNISYSNDNQLETQIDKKKVERLLNFTTGDIESSFWNAGIKAGMTESQIMSLADIFGYDIDFALELRAGDSFNVAFEEKYIDGEFVGYGDIVAAEFINQGEKFTAIRYDDGHYYTPEGRSLRKSFLRAPVNFRYISSNFNPRRFHPIQKRYKPHNGIDYRADTGTPVVAAGDGKVIKASYNRFNGNYVFIQHGEKYVTKYLHFSKRAVKVGQKVRQGQVIGYVGMTGLAEAPHLHYEFLVDGVHRNPRTVKLPKAQPIARSEKAKFMLLADHYLAQLQNSKRIMLAMN